MPNKKNIPGSTDKTKTSENGKTVETVSGCSPTDLLRKLFESQSGEGEIIASDGMVFKFHQWVLEEQIEYFRALFSHQETKRIVPPPGLNLPGPALEALLRYVYYKDTSGMATSFSVTCALVRAGHYYNIPELVNLAAEKIMSKTCEQVEWFNVKEVKELYEHVCLWEKAHPSKGRLIQGIVDVLKKFAKNEEPAQNLHDAAGDPSDPENFHQRSQCWKERGTFLYAKHKFVSSESKFKCDTCQVSLTTMASLKRHYTTIYHRQQEAAGRSTLDLSDILPPERDGDMSSGRGSSS